MARQYAIHALPTPIYVCDVGTRQHLAFTSFIDETVSNSPPAITSDGGGSTASVNAAENQTAVTTVTSTSPGGGALTYSITGGADQAKFAIGASSGILTFLVAPNFEAPTDANTDNAYVVIVQASDGSQTDTQTITVTVTDVVESSGAGGGGPQALIHILCLSICGLHGLTYDEAVIAAANTQVGNATRTVNEAMIALGNSLGATTNLDFSGAYLTVLNYAATH